MCVPWWCVSHHYPGASFICPLSHAIVSADEEDMIRFLKDKWMLRVPLLFFPFAADLCTWHYYVWLSHDLALPPLPRAHTTNHHAHLFQVKVYFAILSMSLGCSVLAIKMSRSLKHPSSMCGYTVMGSVKWESLSMIDSAWPSSSWTLSSPSSGLFSFTKSIADGSCSSISMVLLSGSNPSSGFFSSRCRTRMSWCMKTYSSFLWLWRSKGTQASWKCWFSNSQIAIKGYGLFDVVLTRCERNKWKSGRWKKKLAWMLLYDIREQCVCHAGVEESFIHCVVSLTMWSTLLFWEVDMSVCAADIVIHVKTETSTT